MNRETIHHPRMLLFSPDPFMEPDDPSDPAGPRSWDSVHWSSFEDRIVAAFRAEPITDPIGRWAGGPGLYHVGQTRRLKCGIDRRARAWGVFAAPKSFGRGGLAVRAYAIDRDLRAAFRRLVRACPEIVFVCPPPREGAVILPFPTRPANNGVVGGMEEP
ncbi:MAG TPA: hypothetical protein VG406_00595 [Isosphaeraceae bacterium]|jgi:hypothetical protein|nr:hypothetical protein [Isosphaeraceae bacterium]